MNLKPFEYFAEVCPWRRETFIPKKEDSKELSCVAVFIAHLGHINLCKEENCAIYIGLKMMEETEE